MGKENKVCTVKGFLTFLKDLLSVSLSQNFHHDSTGVIVILPLVVRPRTQRSWTLESLHMALRPSCVGVLHLGQPAGPSRFPC